MMYTDISSSVDPENRQFEPHKGWTEVWEYGRCLGSYDDFLEMESFIRARPDREFLIRLIGRPAGSPRPILRPIGALLAAVGPNGQVRYCEPGEEMPWAIPTAD